MLLDFSDQALDVFFLRDVGWYTYSFAFQAAACRELVETIDSLVDTLLTARFTRGDEDGFCAGEDEGCCCVEAETS